MALIPVLKALGVTLENLFSRKKTVDQYPEQIYDKPVRFHGRHVLNRYEDGMEKCIGCELCAGVCPAHCIYVRGADNSTNDPVSPGERFGFVYDINFLRCIFCGLCVEACPTEAITMTNLFEFSFTNRQDAIYTKQELLVEADGTPRHEGRWFDPHSLTESGGWMRATSPGGSSRYEGIAGWSSDAGHGVRAAEVGQSSGDEVTTTPAAPAESDQAQSGQAESDEARPTTDAAVDDRGSP